MKIAAYGGMFLASPVLLLEFWRFITPGLNPKEKRTSSRSSWPSIVLFTLGGLVAYITFPHALQWLDTIGGPHLTPISTPTST